MAVQLGADGSVRPKLVDVFKYMLEAQERGNINMLGAGPYLQLRFDMTANDARHVVALWLDHGDRNKTPEQMVEGLDYV